MQHFNRIVQANALPPHSKALDILSPVSGKAIDLTTIPDSIFSHKLLGEGTAIEVSGHQLLSPFNGAVEYLPTTCHQVRLTSSSGIKILIQLGVKSENLHGEGYRPRVKQGTKIHQGEVLIDFDIAKLKNKLQCSLFALTMLNSERTKGIVVNKRPLIAGEDKIMTILL